MEEDRTPGVLGHPVVARAARWGVVAWATIGVGVLAVLLYRYVVFPIRIIFPPLILAVVVVYLLNPVVSALQRRGIARVWGSLLVYLVFAFVVGTGLYFLIPVLTDQVTSFVDAAPRFFERVTGVFEDLARRLGVDLQPEAAVPSSEGITAFFGRLVSITRGLIDLAIIFILGPILGFYFLVDLPKINRALKAAIPERRRAEVEGVLEKIGRAVGGFFRGQLLVALVVGIASSIALWVVGLPFWAVVGLAAGLFNLIPLIGPFIGGAIALLVAFTTDTSGGLLSFEPGWPLALASVVGLLIVQQLDNHIVSPNIVGRTVRLHPVTVMLGLLVGGTLMGLFGMILAIPVIASVKILFLHYWDTKLIWPPTSDAGVHADRTEGTATASVSVPPPGAPPGWLPAVRGLFAGRRPAADEAEAARPEPAPERPAGSPGP